MEEDERILNRNLKLIVRTSFVVFIAIVLAKVLVYVYRVLVARVYGAQVYGLYSLSLMVSGVFIALFSLGLTQGILRYVSYYRGKDQTENISLISRFAKRTLAISSILAGIVLFFSAKFISLRIFNDAGLIFYLQIFSLVIVFSILTNIILAMIRAYEKIGWYSFLSLIVHNVTSIILLLILILLGFEGRAVPLSYLGGSAITFALSYFVSKFKLPSLVKKSSLSRAERKSMIRELVTYSLPLLFSGFVVLIFHWADAFSLGYLKGVLEVGFYSAAVPIAALLTMAPEIFMKMFFPLMNKEYSRKNNTVIKEMSKQLVKWILIINLPVFILLVVFPGAALNILFGEEFLVAESALRILSVGTLITSLFVIMSQRLISMTGRSKIILFNVLTAAVLNLILNFIFIPMENIWFISNADGINGAAIATLISTLYFVSLYSIEVKHYLSFVLLRRKMLRVFLSALVSMLLLIYAKSFFVINLFNLSFLVSFFLLSYFALILLTNSFDKNDLMIFVSLKRKFINKKDRTKHKEKKK